MHHRPGARLTDRGGTTYRYSVRTRRGVAYSVGVGFISSFLGIGGGVIHVPLLVRALGFPVHVATATSHFVLANMAAVGTVTHIAAGSFAGGTGIHRAIALSLGVVGGAQVGAWLSQRTKSVIIQRLLAVALVGLALRLLVTVL
ncbi:MAG: sulfite exporter TauE/SafE family protein [Candidatus Dormibacteraeota bacterium]|uniref:Probable membrane transporter protein n=1 Tax=Candidatus Aeolococcus gillhamiae TaxID=3127015 RepID=A0A934K0N6_9BACT|nr:sulfite exporter TauE/SafE family protein [Candidatus Dormibacteraeota bacterium]